MLDAGLIDPNGQHHPLHALGLRLTPELINIHPPLAAGIPQGFQHHLHPQTAAMTEAVDQGFLHPVDPQTDEPRADRVPLQPLQCRLDMVHLQRRELPLRGGADAALPAAIDAEAMVLLGEQLWLPARAGEFRPDSKLLPAAKGISLGGFNRLSS